MDGEGHTTNPERPHLELIRGGLSDQTPEEETSQAFVMEPSMEGVRAYQKPETEAQGKILTKVRMSRMDNAIFVGRCHPSEQPHEEPEKGKWIPFHLPWKK